MRRCLIHHDGESTWDLVVEGGASIVEYRQGDKVHRYPLANFLTSDDGKRLAPQLEAALSRARGA